MITNYIDENEINRVSQKNHVYLDPYLSKLVVNENDVKKDEKNLKPMVNKGIIYKIIGILTILL